jgi:hypothetical protein
MDFKLISKNNMGIVVTLILVILLSQSRLFNFLTETALGRMLILLLIIFISYTNKNLGLLAVLFIIIAFNQYDNNIFQTIEGFDGSGNAIASSVIQDQVTILKAKEDILKQKLSALNNKVNSSQTTSTTSSDNSTSTSENFSGREGFCMTDRETNILRGKQSNTIPVFNNSRDQDDNISPSDKSLFSSSYASF